MRHKESICIRQKETPGHQHYYHQQQKQKQPTRTKLVLEKNTSYLFRFWLNSLTLSLIISPNRMEKHEL